jgi:hypothetical protein
MSDPALLGETTATSCVGDTHHRQAEQTKHQQAPTDERRNDEAARHVL